MDLVRDFGAKVIDKYSETRIPPKLCRDCKKLFSPAYTVFFYFSTCTSKSAHYTGAVLLR